MGAMGDEHEGEELGDRVSQFVLDRFHDAPVSVHNRGFLQFGVFGNCEIVCLERPATSLRYSVAFTWIPWQDKDAEGKHLWKKPKGTKKPFMDKDGKPLIWDGDRENRTAFARKSQV